MYIGNFFVKKNENFSSELVIAPYPYAEAHTLRCFFCECGLIRHCSESESVRVRGLADP